MNGTDAAPAELDDRDAFIAEMKSGAAEKPAEPAAKPAEAKKPDADPDADLDELDEKPDAAADPDADLDDEETLAAKDPDTARRFKVLERKEQHIRETAEKREAEVKAREAALAAKEQEAAQHKTRLEVLARRAAAGDVTVLAELGFPMAKTDDEAKQHARSVYEWAKDPRVAARTAKELETGDKLSATEKRLAELEAKLQAKDQEAQISAARDAFLGKVETTAGSVEKAILTQKMLANNPTRAKREMWDVAERLYQTNGAAPTHKQVVIAYEKQRRQELRDLGIDLPKPAANVNAAKPAAKAPAKVANGNAAAKPDAAPAPDPDGDERPRSRDPERDAFIREMAAQQSTRN